MNEKEFEEIAGFPPDNDDLDRANCPHAGEIGHYQCGICDNCKKPRFLCLCEIEVAHV